jgi:hypothetical protein
MSKNSWEVGTGGMSFQVVFMLGNRVVGVDLKEHNFFFFSLRRSGKAVGEIPLPLPGGLVGNGRKISAATFTRSYEGYGQK